MADRSREGSESSLPGEGDSEWKRRANKLSRAALYGALVIAVGVVVVAAYRGSQERAEMLHTHERVVARHGLIEPVKKRLAAGFLDTNGRLVADPPSDPHKWLDPETICLAHYVDADAENQSVDWEGLEAHLAKATGKRIERQEYKNSFEDVAAIKDGKIQLIALHAADAPYLVNNAGFNPVGVLGSKDGLHGNRLNIAVRAGSKIQGLADIRGRQLTCTTRDSITGYRAAIAELCRKAAIRPDEDYDIDWSGGQKESILGLADGRYEVAACSDDKLKSMLKKGSVKPTDFRTIHQTEVIPRLTIGFVYNLDPTLAAKLTSAILEFANDHGAPEDADGAPMQFVAANYKDDFEFVREIDDCFNPRLKKTPKTKRKSEPGSGPMAER